MIEGKRVKNYLAYAIGEIILVVIGILIAIALNDWKQEKIYENELNGIINVVINDLENDLKEAKTIIKTSKPSQQLIEKILYKASFKDSIRNCEDCRYILTGTQITDFNYKGYELLTNYSKDISVSNKRVDSILNFYENYSGSEFQIKNNFILEEVVDNMKFLRDNFDWYSAYFIGGNCNDDCLDYFESANYINRLTYFEALFYDDFLYSVERYSEDIEKLLIFLKPKEE